MSASVNFWAPFVDLSDFFFSLVRLTAIRPFRIPNLRLCLSYAFSLTDVQVLSESVR